MGPPGGGRNVVTPRMLRHFNVLAFATMGTPSYQRIFTTILQAWIDFNFQLSDIKKLAVPIVNTTLDVFYTIVKELLPTPIKSHYTFNLRDLSKVFQGVLQVLALPACPLDAFHSHPTKGLRPSVLRPPGAIVRGSVSE